MAKVTKPAAPDHLTMNLFAPGMTALHRAGLGGLACTLKAIERHHKAGLLRDDKVPGEMTGGEYPWAVDEQSVTLRFGKPENAGAYLKALFAFAFQIRDGVIFLPGQYPDPPPSLAVRAEMQAGLTLTFIQHGQTRELGPTTPYYVDPDGSGSGTIAIDFRHCTWFKHQDGWCDLRDAKTQTLGAGRVEVSGPLNPGAVVRHVAFGLASRIDERPSGVLPLYFGMVGCLALTVTRGTGILLVPEVNDLESFQVDRPQITPRTVAECRVAGVGDAVLQALVRLRARSVNDEASLPGCLAARFAATAWASKQKSRVNAVTHDAAGAHKVEPSQRTAEDTALTRFEVAMAELPPRVRHKVVAETIGTGKSKQRVDRDDYFWAESAIRPHIAANLATGRPWYDEFVALFRDEEARKRVSYETGGLRAMAKNRTLTDDDEARYIAAVHRAIYRGRGRIYRDTMGVAAAEARMPASDATFKRWEKFMQNLRLRLVGAKTATQVQDVISELLARYGTLTELRDRAAAVLVREFAYGDDWQRARNLALFALASYVRPTDAEPIVGDPEDLAETNSPINSTPEV